MRKAAEIMTAFADRSELEGIRSFYLVGIGGAGMSALARMLHLRGFEVSGSDSTDSSVLADLRAIGISIQLGHEEVAIRSGHALVLTDAIDLEASPEVRRARELDLPLFRRSQVLGWLLRGKKLIAVTGTHGKTTTTGMIGSGLIKAGLDPLVVVGATIPVWGSSVYEGNGEWAVAEACEAYDSFHDLEPTVIVLTNLEADHLDFHGTYTNLVESVSKFVAKGSTLIFCGEDSGAEEISRHALNAGLSVTGYGADGFEGQSGIKVGLAGWHNHLNAAGALEACLVAGADLAMSAKGIAAFRGAERRLQTLRDGEITVIDDYAHHPTEIEATLKAIRSTRQGRIVAVFQPHLYSRTRDLIQGFAQALNLADVVFVTDIYPAREEPIPGVSSARIAELVTQTCTYVPSRHLLTIEVAKIVRPGDIVVAMGAGNISEFAPTFVQLLDSRANPMRKTRVAVLYGGDSAEREVSLISGRSVQTALISKGYDSYLVDVSDLLLSTGELSPLVGEHRPDVVFLAVHGSRAEDGAIQGLCELLHLPYTGSGIRSSALAMDKQSTKQILKSAGLPVANGVHLTSPKEFVRLGNAWKPVVVKPNAQGSTVGLSFVEQEKDLAAALEKAFAYDTSVLVEDWMRGMEISVPVLGDRVLPVVEIVPATGKYDFASKYLEGATQEIVPARLTPEMTARAQDYALRAHQALGCAGATRTDMIVNGEDFCLLEVNTLPGMTKTSLLPNSAASVGLAFPELVDWIVQNALVRHGVKA